MKSFEEELDSRVKFGDSQRECFSKGYEAGQQSRQEEIDQLTSWLQYKDVSCVENIRCATETLYGEFRDVQDIVEQRQFIRTVIACLKGEPPLEVIGQKRVVK